MDFYKRLIGIGALLSIICSTGCATVEMITTPTIREVETHQTVTTENFEGLPESWMRTKDGMIMLLVPEGEFQMGSSEAEIAEGISLCRAHYNICNDWYYQREGSRHSVSLDSFWIDQNEVSNAQYLLCVEDGVCLEPTHCKKGEPTFTDPEKTDHPVVCVDWYAAETYCEWAGARLPTEAEWEYAYRGEQSYIFAWGNSFDGNKLNYCDINCEAGHKDERYNDGYTRSAPVGSFPGGASWMGALNLAGNVSEWTSDWLGEYPLDEQHNPQGPEQGDEKVVKGCSWFFHPTYCRGAARGSLETSTQFDYVGFRCAISYK